MINGIYKIDERNSLVDTSFTFERVGSSMRTFGVTWDEVVLGTVWGIGMEVEMVT